MYARRHDFEWRGPLVTFFSFHSFRTRVPKKHSLIKVGRLNSPLEDRLMDKYIKRKSFEVKPWGSLVCGKKKIPVSSIKAVPNSFHNAYSSPVYNHTEQNFIPSTFLPLSQETVESKPIHVKLGYLNGDLSALANTGENEEPDIKMGDTLYNGFLNTIDTPRSDNIEQENHSDEGSSEQSTEKGVIIHVDNTKL